MFPDTQRSPRTLYDSTPLTRFRSEVRDNGGTPRERLLWGHQQILILSLSLFSDTNQPSVLITRMLSRWFHKSKCGLQTQSSVYETRKLCGLHQNICNVYLAAHVSAGFKLEFHPPPKGKSRKFTLSGLKILNRVERLHQTPLWDHQASYQMNGIEYTSPRKVPGKKVQYRAHKEGPRGGVRKISERKATRPLPKPSLTTADELRAALERVELPGLIDPSFDDCCGFGDGMGDIIFGENGWDDASDTDTDEDDEAGLEDMLKPALAEYMSQFEARGDYLKASSAKQSGDGTGKGRYSKNLKQEREHWKEFVDCVTGESAWRVVKDWGREDSEDSEDSIKTKPKPKPLCACTKTVTLPTVFWTGIFLLFTIVNVILINQVGV